MSPTVPPVVDEVIAWAGRVEADQIAAALAVDPPPVSAERKAALTRLDELGLASHVRMAIDSRSRPYRQRLSAEDLISDPHTKQRFAGYVSRAIQAAVNRPKLTPEEFDIIVAPLRAAGYDFGAGS